MSWDLFKVVSGLDQTDEKVQVTMLLHVLGRNVWNFFSNFVWNSRDYQDKIVTVKGKTDTNQGHPTRM